MIQHKNMKNRGKKYKCEKSILATFLFSTQLHQVPKASHKLLSTEGFGAPSQKTSLLGGVAQILIYPRPSPRLAEVGLFVRPKFQHKFYKKTFQNLYEKLSQSQES